MDKSIQPPPIPPQSRPPQGSKKTVVVITVVALVLIIGIVLAVVFSKSGNDKVEANSEVDSVQLMFEEEGLNEVADYYGHTDSQMDKWNRKFLLDEFGEEDPSQPYLQTVLNGELYLGQADEGQFESMVVTIYPEYGIELSESGTLGSAFGPDFVVSTKGSDGEVYTYPTEYDDGNLYIQDPRAIQRFISVMDDGDFMLAISGEGQLSYRRLNFRITDETRGIRKALRLFRDVPNIERIYGTIN